MTDADRLVCLVPAHVYVQGPDLDLCDRRLEAILSGKDAGAFRMYDAARVVKAGLAIKAIEGSASGLHEMIHIPERAPPLGRDMPLVANKPKMVWLDGRAILRDVLLPIGAVVAEPQDDGSRYQFVGAFAVLFRANLDKVAFLAALARFWEAVRDRRREHLLEDHPWS